MIVIGLTGLIGSGKTTVLNYFKNFGVKIFNCDDYVNTLSVDPKVVKEIESYFPESIKDNEVNKIILKNLVFKNYEKNIKILENIYHPYVIEEIKSIIYKNRIFFWKILVLEVPLLFEIGLDKICKYTILTSCEENIRISRINKRSFIEDSDLKKIIKKQGGIEEKIKLVDFVINTNQDLYSIESDVKDIIEKIKLDFPIIGSI